MRLPRRALLLVAAAVAAVAGPSAATIVVEPGQPVADVAARARSGTTLVLAPGVHDGFRLDRSVHVVGEPGAVVHGEVFVAADGSSLRDLLVVGSRNGITVRDAGGVTLERIEVLGADLHGIELIRSQGTIRGCRIGHLRSPYAQAIEVRMVVNRPITTIEGCSIVGGMEGILSHAARVLVRDNQVTGTHLRGIAITEMSEGLAEGNAVSYGLGAGLFCGDMSHCEYAGNLVDRIASDGEGVHSTSGWGGVVWYHATARFAGNSFARTDAGTIEVMLGSSLSERFPLGTWPHGWPGALPGIGVALASIAGLVLVTLALAPVARRLRARAPAELRGDATAAVLGGFAVQSFHMVEHGVQVVQVYVLNSRLRQGFLGHHVDAEWMHLVYNAVVLGFLIWTLLAVFPRSLPRAHAFLVAAAAIQAYHLVEHVAKMAQYLGTGVKPAPGLLGGRAGLVWFHFGINLAVYAGMAVAVVALAVLAWRQRPRPRRVAPAPAPARG